MVLNASLVAQTIKNPPEMRETWFPSLGWEDPLEEGMATHSCILAWKILRNREAWQPEFQVVFSVLSVFFHFFRARYFCLGNPMDRGAWQATVLGVAKT